MAAMNDAMKYVGPISTAPSLWRKREFPEVKPAIVKDALIRLRDSGTIPASPDLPSAWDSAIKLRHQLGDLRSAGSCKRTWFMQYIPSK
ncbi:MAG: hypothetical protein U0103_11600 [Candidatus Obscuribacterales bacterium]